MFVVKLYGFCLSIAYIARRRYPYIESLLTANNTFGKLYIQLSDQGLSRAAEHDEVVEHDVKANIRCLLSTVMLPP